MAFSMLLRSSACSSRVFTQQVMSMASQPAFQRAVAKSLPIRSLALNEAKSTPLLNAVRSFRTSAVRMSTEKAHDHSKLWVVEKAVSAVLIPLLPIGLLMPNKVTDAAIALLVCAHSFWGLEAVAVDYVRASIVGPVIPKIAIGFVYLLTIATLGGLFYLISHDVGIANITKQIWAVKSEQKA